MIIEFNGLAGSGKTTIARLLGSQLSEQGHKVCYTYPIRESRFQRYCSYIADGSLVLWFLGMQFAIWGIQPRCVEKYRYVSNLISYFRMYRCFIQKCSDEVLIVDQGIIQGLASVAHMDQIVGEKALDYIFSYLKKKGIEIYSVECKNDPILSHKRIRGRNSAGGRWERCGDEEMKCGLVQQTETFNVIRQCSHSGFAQKHISVDTKLSPEQNVRKISRFVGLYIDL